MCGRPHIRRKSSRRKRKDINLARQRVGGISDYACHWHDSQTPTTFAATPPTNTCVNAPTNTTDKPSQSTSTTSGSKGSSRSSSRRGGAGPIEASRRGEALPPTASGRGEALPPTTTHASSTSATSRSGGAGSGLGEEGMCAGDEAICATLAALGLQARRPRSKLQCSNLQSTHSPPRCIFGRGVFYH